MALLNARRRFLITVPLAILLPAGLLTYLGIETVKGIELRYQRQIEESLSHTIHSVRNRTIDHLQYTIYDKFRNVFQDTLQELKEKDIEHEDISFQLEEALPFADKIFIYHAPDTLYFFERSKEEGENNTWIRSEMNNNPFRDSLKNDIDIKRGSSDGEILNPLRFRYFSFPNESYLSLTLNQRELAIYSIENREMNIAQNTNDIISSGFTFRFEYLNTEFFQSILQEMWNREGAVAIPYPIGIVDHFENKIVAKYNFSESENFSISREYLSRYFYENMFPWYRVHYSSITGLDKKAIARNEKIIYSSLIAAAILSLLIGVIGTSRNIVKELKLSDMQTDFVARVSHELRTPLSLIRLYSETLEMNRMKDGSKRKEYLHAITKESERLSHLINNVLDFSQIEENKKYYSFVNVPIEDIINETLDGLHYHLERNEIALQTSIEDNLPIIQCDPESIKQALYNIISNAIKYSGEGKRITVKSYTTIDNVIIEVSDEGIGIPNEEIKKIFQKFYRVDNPIVRKTGGSGLGLSVVKHIIESHGGQLLVTSQVNKGSTFTIQLPYRVQSLIHHSNDN